MATTDAIYAKVDQFNLAMADLQGRLGSSVTMRQVIDSEVSSIITATIRRTKKATTSSIIKSFDSRPPWRTYGGKKYKLTNRYPNPLWSTIQTNLARSLGNKLAAKAFAAQTWYIIGLRVGAVQAAADVVSARKSGVNNAQNIAVNRSEQDGNYGLSIENRSPLLRFSDGRQALFTSIAGRIGFYRRNLANGVFNDMATVLKKYPGFTVSQ